MRLALIALALLFVSMSLMVWGNSEQFRWQPSDPLAPRCAFDCPVMGLGRVAVGASIAALIAAIASFVAAIWKHFN